jgi:hypothetical protein
MPCSGLSAIVVRFSRSRGRYERRGVLVEDDALARAERECLADAEPSAQCALRRHERRALEDLKPHAQHPRGRGPSVRGSIGEIARQLGELRRPPAEVAWRAELGECSAHGLLESRPVLRAAAALVDVDAGVTQERASAGHELSRFAGKHVIGE